MPGCETWGGKHLIYISKKVRRNVKSLQRVFRRVAQPAVEVAVPSSSPLTLPGKNF
jgi:hypothetical protein